MRETWKEKSTTKKSKTNGHGKKMWKKKTREDVDFGGGKETLDG